jgi:4-aminobutyrate aminotransferase/(S)-3-amino-2-methylpropionate transaminase
MAIGKRSAKKPLSKRRKGSDSDVFKKYRQYVITEFVKTVAPIAIDRGNGAVITDSYGREYLDCFAGISVVNAGHCNPEVVAAAKAQMEKLIHCSSYLYHVQPTADLAERIAQIAPGNLNKTFFASSGAEAIEGALKLARLYTGKHEFIALQAGFHGRTWGTLSVSGNMSRKKGGGPYASGVFFAPAPYIFRSQWRNRPEECGRRCAQAIEDIIRYASSGDVAAFIAEPVMGEGGIIVPPLNYFREVKEILDRYGILFIADEVQCGFARTGRMFASEHFDVIPDILVTAKGIADGFPLSALTTCSEIAKVYKPGDHLSTFGGNPVCCAAALANIDFIVREDLCGRALEMGKYTKSRLLKLRRRNPLIGDVRGLGFMIGIEMVQDEALTPASEQAEAIRNACLRDGLLIGLGGVDGNVLRFQPPLVISKKQIDQAIDIFSTALQTVASSQ